MSDLSLVRDQGPRQLADSHESPAISRSSGVSDWLPRLAAHWQAAEARIARLSDWVNPILVKETRQALRSWQFSLTFLLLLVACWVVTIGGVAVIGPSIYYAAGGGELLRAYYLILSLPLLVVVPFAAFRSLAAEREDNTYELLSITSLRPRQIISGKLASSVVQMVVYFSAIMPCIAFTYLLRGVDAPSIALLLVYTFVAAVSLSMVGLLLATLSRQRYGHLVLSVAFVAMLLYGFGMAQELAAELIQSGYELYAMPAFWIVNLFGGTLIATILLLAYLAAAAMITFATENRSTPLRLAMLLQQAVIVGWFAYLWLANRHDAEIVLGLATVCGLYWFALGTLLNGEQPEMSRRVMRSLPQSFLGRLFFTWLNPGPSSGFAFSVANLTAILAICLVPILLFVQSTGARPTWPNPERFLYLLVIGWSYIVAYLGLGCLVVALLRKVSEVTMFASALLHLLLVLAGSGIPTSLQWMSLELQSEPYSYLQVTNPFWTLSYIWQSSPTPEEPVLMVLIPAAAICALLLNLPGMIRELERVRVALPERVAADEVELHPPPEALPQSPWD
jgi:ABC-type transport system involved in multi-copper enzyme maturation permease subunit